MPRSMWKGAISFGLVHIPVEMHLAVQEHDLDLTMLDKRDFSPVGFKRYNKGSGKDVSWDNIVKGYEYQDDEYVVLTDEDLKRANVSATQTIDILAFVDAQQVPLIYYEQPYYLAPGKGGDKVYALLRETLRKSDKVGIATVVIRVKQHLCALVCMGDAIMLNTLRYENEIRAADDLKLPPASMKAAGIADKELQMALSLVEGMAEDWKPAQYHDSYHDDVLALVQKKIKAGQTKSITVAEPERKAASSGNVIDLVALLQQSLGKKPGKAAADNDADEVSLDDEAPSAKPRKTTSTTRRAPAKSAAHADSATTTKSRKAAAKTATSTTAARHTGQRLADGPQALRRLRVGRPRTHAEVLGRIGIDRACDVDVLAVHATHALQACAGRAPDGGRGALLHGLAAAVGAHAVMLVEHAGRAQLVVAQMPRQPGIDDATRMNGERADAMSGAAPVQIQREQRVCSFGLAICLPLIVSASFEIRINDIDAAVAMAARRQGYNARAIGLEQRRQ